MGSTYAQILLHIVFSTKGHRRFIGPGIRDRLFDFMSGIVRDEKGTSLGMGGVEDHVHMLVHWRTDEGVAYLMRNVKSRSSRWIHETFPDLRDFGWQDGYSVFSVSQARVEAVKEYIARQEQHHQQRSFEAKGSFATRAEARQPVFEWIEVFHNRQRFHSTLGYCSPSDFEAAA